MALLSATDRLRTAYQWMRENTTTCSFLKQDLRDAVVATDQWLEDNQTTFNLALPLAFRTSATPAQKAALLGYVAWRRIGKLRAQEDS